MMGKYEKAILSELLDKYENSKSFKGSNKVNQSFKVRISALFPKYDDHSNYSLFRDINEEVEVLMRKGLVISKKSGGGVIREVYLKTETINEAYKYLNRTPKSEINYRLEGILKEYLGYGRILDGYLADQLKRLQENRSVRFFLGDFGEFERILLAVKELEKLENEQFIREFSVQLYNDSKAFGNIQSRVESLLFEYGDFPEKDEILGNFNLVRTPTHVNFKGAGKVCLSGQEIDLSRLSSDIAISSSMLGDIDSVKVFRGKVMTVENLTTFHSFQEKDYFVIYLGGFHNRVRRDFIKMLYDQNSDATYYHFGDIDAGGFLILEHLKDTTAVSFMPYKMDIDTLKKHKEYGKPLTENDKKRLKKLLNSQYKETIEYMLENNIKLEQEAIV
ncbi:Wadjet anti-phage system protein JetD domain-containing protein [Gudongella sp. DL1XJH-153]|uniref:Wadjet anti-phage system protein JetD domain-containing protein n=2 Tax=Bacillota TaxID=1239 RepID=UPI003BB7F6FF